MSFLWSQVESWGCSALRVTRRWRERTGMGNMGGYVEGVGYLLDGTHVNGIFEGGDLGMESGMSGKMARLKKWQNFWLHYGPHLNPSHSGWPNGNADSRIDLSFHLTTFFGYLPPRFQELSPSWISTNGRQMGGVWVIMGITTRARPGGRRGV